MVPVNDQARPRICAFPLGPPLSFVTQSTRKITASNSGLGLESWGHFQRSLRELVLDGSSSNWPYRGSRKAGEPHHLDCDNPTLQKERRIPSCSRYSPSGEASPPMENWFSAGVPSAQHPSSVWAFWVWENSSKWVEPLSLGFRGAQSSYSSKMAIGLVESRGDKNAEES